METLRAFCLKKILSKNGHCLYVIYESIDRNCKERGTGVYSSWSGVGQERRAEPGTQTGCHKALTVQMEKFLTFSKIWFPHV